jgi:TolB-like protein/Flp pilus assembly protein TadD
MAEIYRFAEFELDTSLFQVRHRGEVLSVQPQVFDVLRYLLQHRDRVVSKDELLDQIWSGRIISETTLSSRIKAVRQLIGDSGDRQTLIRTIRNRGFQFVGQVQLRVTDAQMITRAATKVADAGKTSIAVLPFESYDANPIPAHFGEGMAADIIALLAQNNWLKVISRGSSFAFSAGGVSPQDAGTALGVRFLLMGRIRHRDNRIRIDAELADCTAGAHLWSRKYDAEESDLFSLQDEISEQIAAEIAPELGLLEGQRLNATRETDLDAWECCHKGFYHLYRFTINDLKLARECFDRALMIDEGNARAYAGLAYVAIQMAFYGSLQNRAEALETALDCSRQAVHLDQWDAFGRFALGRTYSLLQRFDDARAELERAIRMNASFAQAYFALGFALTNSGQAKNAIPLFEKAVLLSPRDPHLWTFHHLRAMAHFRLNEMQSAEYFLREAVRVPNATYWPFATLCALLGKLGKRQEAAAIADRLQRMKPGYSTSFARQDFFFAPEDDFLETYIAGLAAAGID